ncbi:MAG: DUF805 domain-containing protein [Burkholderiales bacterium]
MESSNPYTPPQAVVADVGDAYDGAFQEMKVWAWRGRLGRLRLLAYGVVAYLIFVLLLAAVGLVVGLASRDASGVGGVLDVAVWLLLIPYMVFSMLVTIRRSHDMGWSGWMSLLVFIPLVGLIWVFKAGNPGANEYGAPPPPNTAGVKVAAFGLFALVFVGGILAAIAIPAYQQYVQRAAQAAQQVPAK